MLEDWARTWAIPDSALADLRARLGAFDYEQPLPPGASSRSEAAVQAASRVEASKQGMRLWRNNIGAYLDPESGTFVRYGLANDSKQVNEIIKSGDLIGIRPRIIGPEHVGTRIGQFVSIECKAGDWKWRGTPREVAQANWANLVNSLGGDAKFVTHERQI